MDIAGPEAGDHEHDRVSRLSASRVPLRALSQGAGRHVPLRGDGSIVVVCHLQRLMRDLRQRRSDHNDDGGVEAEFWGRSDEERVKAWIATGIGLIGAVAGIAGLTLLGRRFF